MTGTVNIFRYGAGTQGIMRTLGQYMLVSGTTFGFFMSIGSVIRSDADPKLHELYMRAQRRPIVNMASPAWRKSP
ncbi:Protein mgr2 [Metarhizium anisopliae]|nr:Protein mgr2 [Metarhizium anisopliae]